MEWPEEFAIVRFTPVFKECKGPQPQVLLIHLDNNDLGLIKGKVLIIQALNDMALIKQFWPGVVMTWLENFVSMSLEECHVPWGYGKNANLEIRNVLDRGSGIYLP